VISPDRTAIDDRRRGVSCGRELLYGYARMSIPRTRPSPRTGTPSESTPASRPGRRKDAALSAAIIDATLEILATEGYDGLSIEAIARRADVSRPTIYRRWRSLSDLVLDATRQSREMGPVFPTGIMRIPDTGSLREDLMTIMRDGVAVQRSMGARGVQNGFIAGIVADPSLGPVFRANIMDPDHLPLLAVFARARERGELRDDFDEYLALELLTGWGIYRSVITRDSLDDDVLSAAVDIVVAGITKPTPDGQR
jgi:AcrR family transcriptional regulator